MNRDFKGIWIPKEIWLSKDLTTQEKLFIVEIDSLDNEGGCTAGNQYFADFFEISTRRVSEVIQNLVTKGYITSKMIYKENSKQISHRVLHICRPPYPILIQEGYGRKVLGGIEENFHRGIEEKFQDNNIINNNINNNIYNSVSNETGSKKFKKPTLEEVKAYCFERNNTVDAENFINFYESKGWKVGKSPMKDWKACVRTWEKNSKPKQQVQTDSWADFIKNNKE
jgi:hypothetical protein